MKKKPAFFRNFRWKVTLILIVSMILAGGLFNFFIYKYALDSQFKQLREKLMIIAQTAALSIDGDMLMKIPLDKEGMNTRPYRIVLEQLHSIKRIDPILKYVYTMAKTDQEGIWQFIVDPDAAEMEEEGITSFPGDEYDASRFPEMMKAFDGPSADWELGVDEWGVLLSGYAPIRDRMGKTVAMIGVDIDAYDVYAIQHEVHKREIFVLVVGVIFSVIVGWLFSRKITQRINKLVEGTKRIRDGDFRHQVKVGGRDEISELAHYFNIMAKGLFMSRQRMHKYFYRAMQSLVRILEAKDVYTMGHSDRVAEYVEKIALKIKFHTDEIELLVDAARLHDIGKLGIQKTILNKKGKLTEEEWKVIREHPVIGEDILRTVVYDEQMLAMVRYHHERYDGRGYPDGLKGKDINRFAHIIAVADAYDAMTSDRAYRPAMSKQEALEELRRGKGTQFDPKIADAFIELLEGEDNKP